MTLQMVYFLLGLYFYLALKMSRAGLEDILAPLYFFTDVDIISSDMKENKILQKLYKFGFTAPQARLYLAGLRLGKALMKHLAQEAKVSRSTAYYLMSELERRKFFAHKKIGKRIYYSAVSPQELLNMALRREQLVRTIMSDL